VGNALPLILANLEATMPQFDPGLIQLMRSVLEDAMTRVPLEITGTTTKAYVAEAILKAAAQGHTGTTSCWPQLPTKSTRSYQC
jgi:hypothetical protein